MMIAFAKKQRVTTTTWITALLVLSSGCLTWAIDEDDSSTETIEDVIEGFDDFAYTTPEAPSVAHFAESFDDIGAFKSRWVVSDAKKDDIDESLAKYNGEWSVEAALESSLKGDLGLVLKSKAKHHAISAKLRRPFVFDKKPFVVQYEVSFQNGQECGGAYLKLLSDSKDMNLRNFHDKTPYTIMFGPDKCGNDAKLHFIFRHRNPQNGTVTEKHSKKPGVTLDDYFKDKRPHLYTLVLNPDNTFEVLVDHTVVNQGNLLDDFTPPVNPPSEIDDPEDIKPDTWDEREKIVDPDAKKPDDWDEDAPRQITDPTAVKPEGWLDDEQESIPDSDAVKPTDWDEEMDGEWEPPLVNNPKCEKVGCGEWKAPVIDNPDYKGKWYAPFIDNPSYQGKWTPKKIENPDFYEDKHPFKMAPIGAVGFELWSMSDGIYFDNILVVDDRTLAEQWSHDTWALKKKKGDSEKQFSFGEFVSDMSKRHPFYVWLVYFTYVGVPVVVYVGFVRGVVNEETIVTRLIKYTNSHPWLYAVYVVVIGLPIVLVVFFCCATEEKIKKQRFTARVKKTDEVTPDDIPLLAEEDEDANAGPADNAEDISSPTIEEVQEDSDAGGGDSSQGSSQAEAGTDRSAAEKEAADFESSGDTSSGRSPRKHRARKE